MAGEYHWSKTEILEKVYLDEVPKFQLLIKQRHAYSQIRDINVARAAMMEVKDLEGLISEIRVDADLDPADYLDAKLDKSGLASLAQRLSAGAEKKVS